jgi:hypothetical protein
MAQAIVLVCDVCGKPNAQTVTIRVNGKNLQKDLCPVHLADLVKNARAPKRGRRPGSVSKTTVARKPAARKAVARKRGRPRKQTAAKA